MRELFKFMAIAVSFVLVIFFLLAGLTLLIMEDAREEAWQMWEEYMGD